VHNTRRWFAAPATIDGVDIGAGDTVLVVLAAANRDRHRDSNESFSFGAGAHRCPASRLAPRIAAVTIGALLDEWPGVLGDLRVSGCRSLPNARIPTFG
jgi:cytochrome P450